MERYIGRSRMKIALMHTKLDGARGTAGIDDYIAPAPQQSQSLIGPATALIW